MARRPFFSGNYGSALGSTANAANLIARAGETQGQMFANLGSQIGGMIQQYGLNKEKRAKLTDKIENRLKLDPSIAQRLTMSGDEDYDKKNLTLMEKLSEGELGMKGLESLDNAMATIREVDLQKQQDQDRNIKTQMSKALLKEQEGKNEATLNALKTKQANKFFVQKTAQGLINRLAGLPKDKQKEEYDSLDPTSKDIIRRAESIMSGNFDPSNFMPTASERLGMQSDLLKIEELRGNILDDEQTRKDRQKASQAGVFEGPSNAMVINEDGQVARVGTPSENIGPVRTDKAEELIKMGQDAADNFDITSKPLDAPIVAGGDIGGMFEDTLLYLGGKVGLSGKQMDEGIDLGLEEREVQTARLNAINSQIRPTLVRAVTSRGNVYTQKQIDEEILANSKEDNPTVEKKLREYPTLLNNALINAKTVLRDPEIKPGTAPYEQARFIVLQTPKILKQINASIGVTMPSFSDPSIERILGGSRKPNVMPVDPTNRSTLSTEDLLKNL